LKFVVIFCLIPRYTAATTINMITKLKENGNSGIVSTVVTDSNVLPELLMWVLSPEYDAPIDVLPGSDSAFDWKFTEQVPDDRVQDDALSEPRSVFEEVKETIPVGVFEDPALGSVTVALQLVMPPRVIDDGVHDTVVLEGS
jgi:hypothetical protein